MHLCRLSGVHTVAVAAKHYNVPLVVCTGLYKLAPVFPDDRKLDATLHDEKDGVAFILLGKELF